jgi:hypothetical protein
MSRRGRSWAHRYQPARRRGVNADLGHALVLNLASVDPTDERRAILRPMRMSA